MGNFVLKLENISSDDDTSTSHNTFITFLFLEMKEEEKDKYS